MPSAPELSHVGMAACYFCDEDKEIVLHTRLRPTLPRSAVYDRSPCPACADLLKKGILLILVKECPDPSLTGDTPEPYRLGQQVLITEEAARRLIQPPSHPVFKHRWAYVDLETWKALGLPLEAPLE